MTDADLKKKRDALRRDHADAMRRHEQACEDVSRISRELNQVNAEIERRAVDAFESANE